MPSQFQSGRAMIRFVVRLAGFILLAAGFAALVVDGTRSIAANGLLVTPSAVLLGSHQLGIEQFLVQRVHPLAWNPGLISLLRLPLALLLGIVGLGFVALARRPEKPVGYSSRR